MKSREPWLESLRKQLHEHEEPYTLGAWETFESRRTAKKRTIVRRRWLSAAAVLLIGAGLWWTVDPDSGGPASDGSVAMQMEPDLSPLVDLPDTRLAKPLEEESLQVPSEPGPMESAVADSDPGRDQEDVSDDESAHSDRDSWTEPATPSLYGGLLVHREETESVGDELDGGATIEGDTGTRTDGAGISGRTFSLLPGRALRGGLPADMWISTPAAEPSESEQTRVGSADLRRYPDHRGFAWGVAYAPMMNVHKGQSSMAMGAGVHARLQMSEQWGLGSALVLSRSQFQMDADPTVISMFQTTTMAAGGPVILNSRMEADLVSLEVPLHLRYRLSDAWTLSGGLSTVAYLQETYRYRVDYRQQYQTMTATAEGVRMESGEMQRTERQTESEGSLNEVYWGAFYNVAAEFSWLFTDRHWVSVEPFFKVPTGTVASRDLSYSSGGVQLKVYF